MRKSSDLPIQTVWKGTLKGEPLMWLSLTGAGSVRRGRRAAARARDLCANLPDGMTANDAASCWCFHSSFIEAVSR
jgi:hypothetical protein